MFPNPTVVKLILFKAPLCCLIFVVLSSSGTIRQIYNCHDTPERYKCLNGGSCKFRKSDKSPKVRTKWVCTCPKSHTGLHCESPSPCFPFPCVSGHASHCRARKTPDGQLRFVCVCRPGFTGHLCESVLPDNALLGTRNCHDTPKIFPCLNGGSCIPGRQGARITWHCICLLTHTGKTCENLNPCYPYPCVRSHAACCRAKRLSRGGPLTFFCNCYTPYTGKRCESTIHQITSFPHRRKLEPDSGNSCIKRVRIAAGDPCVSSPCTNGGRCAYLNGYSNTSQGVLSLPQIPKAEPSFECICPVSYTGRLCEGRMSVEHWLNSKGIAFNENALYCIFKNASSNTSWSGFLEGLVKRKLLQVGDTTNFKNPCKYGSKCVPKFTLNGKLDYQCQCVPGTQGQHCSSGCPHGRYGPSCKKKCGWCKERKCDSADGTCKLPGCLPGWDSNSKTCKVQKGISVSLTTTLIGRYDRLLQQPASNVHQQLLYSFESWVVWTCQNKLNLVSGCTLYELKFSRGSVKVEYTILLDKHQTDKNITTLLEEALEENISQFQTNGSYSVKKNSVRIHKVLEKTGLGRQEITSRPMVVRMFVSTGIAGTVYLTFFAFWYSKRMKTKNTNFRRFSTRM